MKLAINQPYYLPYIGYWQLIDSADTFAVADNYNFIKQGWIHRNRILDGNTVRYFNIQVDHASQNRFICDHKIKPIDKDLNLRQLKGFYHTAPYCSEGLELMDRILSFEGDNLADFLYESICQVCDYLQINTKIVRTSDFEQDPELRKTDRIFDYCRQMGADTYHNLIGGTKLYSFDEFEERGLKLAFIDTIMVPYPQSSDTFEPGLSILDVIMNNSVEEIQQMLKSYRLITAEQN